MFDGISPAANGLEERLANTGAGLASSLRLAGTGTQQPSVGDRRRLTMPVLVVPGTATRSSPPSGAGWPRPSAPTPATPWCAGPATRPTCSDPTEVAGLVRAASDGPAD